MLWCMNESRWPVDTWWLHCRNWLHTFWISSALTDSLVEQTATTQHPTAPRLQLMAHLQACAKELLQAGGEIAAVAGGFDVIAFSTAPVSWGACYEGHLQLLEGASKPLLGRQNGRRPFRPNSASTGCTRVQVGLSMLKYKLTCSVCLSVHSALDGRCTKGGLA